MPIIHPNMLGDYDSGPFPPSSITTMADVRCSDGFSYGPLSVVSSLCTRAHVCVGRLNHKWRELVNLISPEYADAPPRHQVLIESRLVKYWHQRGGLFVKECGPHFAVCTSFERRCIVRTYLLGRASLDSASLDSDTAAVSTIVCTDDDADADIF